MSTINDNYMSFIDVAFIHSPSYFDFRDKIMITSAFTDGISNSHIYEMYPVGFLTMAAALQEVNYKVKIVNLGVKMLRHPNIDIEHYLKSLNATIYALDLHWMIHAQGVMEVAKRLKKYHPNSKILLGGFTSSYFHEEIMQKYDFIDFILRGDSTEPLVVKLVQSIYNNRDLGKIPNLVWRNGKKIVINPFTYVPTEYEANTSNFLFTLAKMIIQSGDLDVFSYLPSVFHMKRVVLPIIFAKGCPYSCANCGGSRYAMKKISNRDRICLKKPENVAKEILELDASFNFPIRIISDLTIGGRKYAEKIWDIIRKNGRKLDSPLYLEFFNTHNKQYMEKITSVTGSLMGEISPESGSDMVRNKQGRPYSNSQLMKFTNNAKDLGIKSMIYWFQVGNGLDSKESLEQNLKLAADLIKTAPDMVNPFISPLCPYIDPGSLAYEFPEEYGYKLLYKNLEEQIKGFTSPIWTYYLNYETKNFNRNELVYYSYKQAIDLNNIKRDLGVLTPEETEFLNRQLDNYQRLMNIIDSNLKLVKNGDSTEYIDGFSRTASPSGIFRFKNLFSKEVLDGDSISIFDLIKNGIKFMSYKLRPSKY